ncbi:MAG: PEP-CTERM sorting domain-containing protein [Planctomycetes bacterium]|nr:PEP-CTERM sorting domain-containing protein [Planctomycetota bacterium]
MKRQFYTTALAFAIVVSLSSGLHAGLLETQNNPVANGAITVVGGDNDRSDWIPVPSYQSDPAGDAGPIDFTGLQIAHDDTNIYFRILLDTQASPQFFGFQHNLYLDTDLDRSTGFFGGGGFLSTGSDYLIQGGSYFSFAGGAAQGAFSWNWLGGVVWDDFPTTDIEIKIPRAALGNPDAFDILLNASAAPEDYYPNGATGGATGDYFRYSLAVIPEPSSALLILLGGCMMFGLRQRK